MRRLKRKEREDLSGGSLSAVQEALLGTLETDEANSADVDPMVPEEDEMDEDADVVGKKKRRRGKGKKAEVQVTNGGFTMIGQGKGKTLKPKQRQQEMYVRSVETDSRGNELTIVIVQTTSQGTHGRSHRQSGLQGEPVRRYQRACREYIDQAQDGGVRCRPRRIVLVYCITFVLRVMRMPLYDGRTDRGRTHGRSMLARRMSKCPGPEVMIKRISESRATSGTTSTIPVYSFLHYLI
jgi:hypothetical protein